MHAAGSALAYHGSFYQPQSAPGIRRGRRAGFDDFFDKGKHGIPYFSGEFLRSML